MKGDCNICTNRKLPSNSATCVECGLSRRNYKPITNYDLLISKTPEGMAEWVTTKGRTFGEEYEGYMSLLDWLKSPVEDKDG